MERIIKLENELKLNKIKLLKLQETCQMKSDETTPLLVQRSYLKDLLLDEYRKELLESKADQEYLGE